MLLPLFYRRPRCLVNDPAPDVFGQSRGREEGWGWGRGRGWRGVYRLLVLPSLGHCRRQLISSDGQGILIVCRNRLAQSKR